MQEQPHRRGGIVRLLTSLFIIAAAVALFWNRQLIIDQINVWQFQPSSEIVALSERAQLNDNGTFYFYASRPEINDRSSFNQNCPSASEITVVLGCYSKQRIYIFDVDDPRLDGVKEVTAAHEMLHAVYERMPAREKERVNEIIEAQLLTVTDQRIKDLIEIYERTEPKERYNELHSIFATELDDLSDELERHYDQYFVDRLAVVALAKQYESVFTDIREQQSTLAAELDNLAAQINIETESYNRGVASLNQDVAAFNQRAESGGYSSQAAFNADRSALMNRQQQLENARIRIDQLIATYNEKRETLISINGQAEELNQSLDSEALEPSPSF